MARSVLLCSSIRGQRQDNEDFVATRLIAGRRRAAILTVCDGVGSSVGSGACAHATGEAAITAAKAYAKRFGCRTISLHQSQQSLVTRFAIARSSIRLDSQLSTTVALAVVSGDILDVLWAGDSRVYTLDASEGLRQVTVDQHDSSGQLVSYIDGAGRLHGKLNYLRTDLPRTHAVCVTSDGVHESCTADDLWDFIVYCISSGVTCGQRLGDDLAAFLKSNLSDNASLALYYTFSGQRDLAQMLAQRPSARRSWN